MIRSPFAPGAQPFASRPVAVSPFATAATTTPLLLTATLKAIAIATPSPASPFSIDAERSQELPPNYGT